MAQRRDIEEEAAAWLAALDCGTADRAAFERWRILDPAHAIAFLRIHRDWQRLTAHRAILSERIG